MIPRNVFPSFSHLINYVTHPLFGHHSFPSPLYIQHIANSHLPCYHHVFPNAKKVKPIFLMLVKTFE
jgi:hypothetical protein